MAAKTVKATAAAIDRLSTDQKREVFKVEGIPYLFVRATPQTKTFFYQRTIKARQKRHTIGQYPGTKLKDAKTAAEALSSRYAMGEDVEATEREERAVWTVEEAWKAYKAKNVRKGGKSIESFNTYWKLHFSKLKARKLTEVTDGMAESLQRRVLETRSGATTNRVTATGRALFNFARKQKASGFRGPNPFDGLERQPEKRRTQRIYRSQIPAFFKALDNVSPTMRDFILLAVYTGRRAADLRTMRWVDVDLDSSQWLIPDPKAGEPQAVALVDEATEILKKRHKEAEGVWVFPADSKSGHMAKGGYRKAWAAVQKEAGLQDVRFHDLRRSVASIAFEMGASKQVVGAMLGHKDASTTERIYQTISHEAQRAVAKQSAKAWTEAAK
jgi:integrase